MPTRRSLLVLAAAVALIAAGPARARDKSIVVASTTSTQDSGLFGHILPLFKAKTGKGSRNAAFALQTIKAKGAPFISRGDNSGTHIAEIKLWKDAGIDIKKEAGPWYKSIGQGMGATLNVAAASGAYALSDRGTWISFKNKADLVIAV